MAQLTIAWSPSGCPAPGSPLAGNRAGPPLGWAPARARRRSRPLPRQHAPTAAPPLVSCAAAALAGTTRADLAVRFRDPTRKRSAVQPQDDNALTLQGRSLVAAATFRDAMRTILVTAITNNKYVPERLIICMALRSCWKTWVRWGGQADSFCADKAMKVVVSCLQTVQASRRRSSSTSLSAMRRMKQGSTWKALTAKHSACEAPRSRASQVPPQASCLKSTFFQA